MGMILEDSDNGIHCEKRRESIVLLSDYGQERIEMSFDQARKAIKLLTVALEGKA